MFSYVFTKILPLMRQCRNVYIYIVEPDWPQMTIWRMRISRWVPKSTNTHWQCVILIVFLYNNGCTNAPQCYVVVHCLSYLLFPYYVRLYVHYRRRVRFHYESEV